MKKFINILLAVLFAAVITSCEKEQFGTIPGTDPMASVRVYTYAPALPYDADCDVIVRLAANSSAKDVYLFAETAAQKEARNLVESAYADYVVANGTKVTLTPNEFDNTFAFETTLEGLKGDNVISAVAINANGDKSISATSFFGIEWLDLAAGEYYCNASSSIITRNLPGKVLPTVLQQRKDQTTTYRLQSVFGKGKHLVFNTIDQFGEDEGKYQFCRVPAQNPGLNDASYGSIGIRDLGYWQNDDSFITEGGYECGMYEDYNCFFIMQWFVSAGNLGYNWYDFFVPED